jgi:hypothetical protein
MRTAFALLGVLTCLSGCGDGGLTSANDAPLPVAEVSNGHFRLALRATTARYAAGEPIAVGATLTYAGPARQIEVAGSGSGLVGFGVEQVDGNIKILPAGTADCHPWTLPRGDTIIPFQKSGGFSADDPGADFFEDYFHDPALRLPAGTWRISAEAVIFPPDCDGPPTSLATSIEVTVE